MSWWSKEFQDGWPDIHVSGQQQRHHSETRRPSFGSCLKWADRFSATVVGRRRPDPPFLQRQGKEDLLINYSNLNKSLTSKSIAYEILARLFLLQMNIILLMGSVFLTEAEKVFFHLVVIHTLPLATWFFISTAARPKTFSELNWFAISSSLYRTGASTRSSLLALSWVKIIDRIWTVSLPSI